MDKIFDIIRVTRGNFLKVINNLDLASLNRIPVGFRNNIAWNVGHIITTQQVLCYEKPGLPMYIDSGMLPRFGKDTFPGKDLEATELERLKAALFSTIDQLESDWKNGLYMDRPFPKLVTSYGVTLEKIEDVIPYVATHEGLHFGYTLALRRAL